MKKRLLELQYEHERKLRKAAIEYLRTGLDLFHQYKKDLEFYQKKSYQFESGVWRKFLKLPNSTFNPQIHTDGHRSKLEKYL